MLIAVEGVARHGCPQEGWFSFVTVAWQEARTRHFVCWSLQAFVNYLKGTVAVNTRTTGTRRNVGRQRAIVYVGNYAKSRIKCNVREQHAQRRQAATLADDRHPCHAAAQSIDGEPSSLVCTYRIT